MTVRISICALLCLALILFITHARAANETQSQPQSRPEKQSKESKEQAQTQPQTEVVVNYDILLQGTYSGFKDPLQKVIQTDQEFGDLWKKHVSVIIPQPPIPQVDFNTSLLVAIYMGEQKTSGYQILLRKVEAKQDNVVVHYHFTQAPEHGLTLQVITQPFMFIRIEKPKGQVELVKE